MGLWQITDNEGVPTDETFDDKLPFNPGEDGFTQEHVRAHTAPGQGFNFIGRSPEAYETRQEELRKET